MNYSVRPKKRLNHVISSWTSFAFVLFIFYIFGDLIANWWHNAWWVWLILGFSLIGAISTTFRYLASGSANYSVRKSDSEYSSDTGIHHQSIESSEQQNDSKLSAKAYTPINVRFCKNCGGAIENPSQFCASCGEEL